MREVGERNALNVIASSGSKEFEKDITKIIRGYRKVTEDWRSILRADYLMMLKTLICIRNEHVVVRARNGEVWVGRLSAIDPDHLNIFLINAENVILRLSASKVLIRGDQIELILHFPNRDQALNVAKRIIPEKL